MHVIMTQRQLRTMVAAFMMIVMVSVEVTRLKIAQVNVVVQQNLIFAEYVMEIRILKIARGLYYFSLNMLKVQAIISI